MTAEEKCNCGAMVDAEDKFCNQCGAQLVGLPHITVCPGCGNTVSAGNFCPKCRENLAESEARIFAALLPSETLSNQPDAQLLVRHGTKALFFKDGRLEKIVEEGCIRIDSDEKLKGLFKSRSHFSAVVVDAGNLIMSFTPSVLKTRDGLPVDVHLELVVKLEQPVPFYVNVMKDASEIPQHAIRSRLASSVRQALSEFFSDVDHPQLADKAQLRNVLSSVIETKMRPALMEDGLALVQVRALTVEQKEKEAIQEIKVDGRLEAEKIRAETDAFKETGDEKLARQTAEVEHLEKRQSIFKRILAYKVDEIKTEEEFRKFKMEVDREQLLDGAEWQEMQDEILWKGEDRRRDREFLVNKIKLQQQHELALKKLILDDERTAEAKKQERERLQEDLNFQLDQELQRAEHRVKIARAEAEADQAGEEIKQIGAKKIEIEQKFAELEFEIKRDEASFESKAKKIKLGELANEMMSINRERKNAIQRRDDFDRELHRLKVEKERLEMDLRKALEAHKRSMEELRLQTELEIQKMQAMAGMSLEQLIAMAPGDNAAILGDLAQSQALRGMTPEEILAMRDPAALGRALEERARASQNEEFKGLYEQMQTVLKETRDEKAEGFKHAAEMAERMFAKMAETMSGQNQDRMNDMRHAVGDIKDVSGRAMDNMGQAHGSQHKAGSQGGAAGTVPRVCKECGQPLPEGANFCRNCGKKTY